MATRLYLPSTGSAAVSPSISADWSGHVNVARRPLNAVNGGSVMNTLAFAPDAADHLVAGNAHFVQFVSDVLPAQTIAAQTIKLQVRAAEDNAGNNLFLAWKLYAVSEDGQTALGNLVSLRTDGTEVATALTNRADSVTSTQFVADKNFRLVLEMGLNGTPVNTTGTQGHNGSLSFGENAATDLPEDDAATGALNPWLQFSRNIKYWVPATAPANWVRLEIARARGDAASPAGWAVSQVILSSLMPFENRQRFGKMFGIFPHVIDWDHDDIMVLMTDITLTAAQIERVTQLRTYYMPLQKACVLDNGLRLSDLTPAQIAARVV